MERLYKKLKEYGDSDYYPYHMPGHKRQLIGAMPRELMKLDITEIEGFDNLHQAEGILAELQEKASALYGAEETFYLVNGSTCGILSAISAALPRGGHILMARNCHKSAYHAAYLRNLTISYLYPDIIEEYDICGAIMPGQVEKALEAEPDIEAVFLVSPTYEGRIADIKAIADLVHKRGIPLIVDEAHGAHLGLVKEVPRNSSQQGADIVIHSVHKTLPAMTQTALLHVNGNLIDRSKLRRFLHIYQSSSPSYVLMASIDNALQLVEEQGEQLFQELYENYKRLLQKLEVCKHLKFLPLEEGKQDVGKLVISSKDTGLSGQEIYDMLLKSHHLQLEMAAGSYCLAMFTIGDGIEAYERLEKALLAIDAFIEASGAVPMGKQCFRKESLVKPENAIGKECREAEDAIPLSKAWDMETEIIPLNQAIGRPVGEFINLYPPGAPLLVPGEVLREAQYEQLLHYRELGLSIQGIEAQAPFYVKVLADKNTEFERINYEKN